MYQQQTIIKAGVSVFVSTKPYWLSHLKAPSGRGSWAFDISIDGGESVEQFWHNGTYAEARKAAIARARQKCDEAGARSASIDVLS